MARDDRLHSGFVTHDYVVTFEVRDEARRRALVAQCRDAWDGDEVTATTWEISTALRPAELEDALVRHLEDGDRLAYYYLSDTKRMFRVLLR